MTLEIGKNYHKFLRECIEKYRNGDFEEINEQDENRRWKCYSCLESVKVSYISIKFQGKARVQEVRFHQTCLGNLLKI